ncbi:hypothetical protein [Methanolobus vulcani]|uniref:Uncharacterized protein n=1 Tax=Methanolobus vulcani TaxID=38026 RepID=A0A7Z8KP56_9EURY|nr:hypothetical protein [Methanolobus vulcani]TQD26308.1 hypothetical protein FKV42_06045 [Methanolobus vulcani]
MSNNLLIGDPVQVFYASTFALVLSVIFFIIIKNANYTANARKVSSQKNSTLLRGFNPKYVGNIFDLKPKIMHCHIIIIIITITVPIILEYALEIKSVDDFDFSSILISIAIPVITLGIKPLITDYKVIIKLFKHYFKLDFKLFLYILLETYLTYRIFNSFSRFPSYAIIGSSLWLISGAFRILFQKSTALFCAQPKDLAQLIMLFGYFRMAYFALGYILIINKLDFISNMYYLISNISSFSLLDLLYMSVLIMLIYATTRFIITLYPYFTNDPEVQTSIEILQYVSTKKKGTSIQNIESNFNLLSKEMIEQYLNNLISSKYIYKYKTKYKLTSEYELLLKKCDQTSL